MRDDLLEMADLWEKSGEAARAKGHNEAATALIGCAQALRERVLQDDDA